MMQQRFEQTMQLEQQLVIHRHDLRHRFQTDENDRPITNSMSHGIGTRSIAAYCEKYGAVCNYKTKDGWFTIRIVQPA